ncbi:MAG: metallophosphoesterase family protein, partial [Acidimicrobiales bacterium]
MALPWQRPSTPQIWAAEHDALQLFWGDLPAGVLRATGGDTDVSIDHPGGPGALVVDGLAADTAVRVTVSVDGTEVATVAGRTLPRPPGELLARFATVSDLHIGARRWGFFKTMNEARAGLDDHPEAHPYRCAQAAIADAATWGAEHLVIKGDGAHHRVPDDFAELGRLLDGFPDLAMTLLPGNHDVDEKSAVPLPATVGRRAVPYVRSVTALDLPGVRIVAGDTTIEGKGSGTVEHHGDEVLSLVEGGPRGGGVIVATHQQFQKAGPLTYWPPGIAPPGSVDFLAELGRVRPGTLVTSGHTHRNRVRRVGDVVHSEVASTRDWPGVWGAYWIFEGGVVQSARKISSPAALAWHEYSKNAVGGVWERWAPGTLGDRCFTHRWR